MLPGARHRAYDLASGAGPLQGLHLDAQAERLLLHSYHRDRAEPAARRAADSHRGDARDRGIRDRRAALYKDDVGSPTEMLSRRSSAYAWLRRTIELLAEGSNPEEFLEHTKLELFHDQVFCFTPKGKLIALAAAGERHRLRLCGAHRRRQHGGRLQDQRQDRAAGLRAHQRRRGRDHHLPGADRRRRPGGSLVTTGKARAAIRRATAPRCATSMPASVDASWSGSASVRRSPIPTKSCKARCRGWRAPRSKRCCPRSGAARCARPSRAPCIPTTRKSVPPRSRSSPSRRAAGSASRRRSR